MNCREFDSIRTALGRSEPLSPGVRGEALDHAAACRLCGQRLAGERQVTASLAALAAASRRDAPARVERALLETFGFNQAVPHRPTGWAAWAAGAAAAVLLAGFLFLRPSDRRLAPPAPPQNPAPLVAAAPPAELPAAPAPAPARVKPRRRLAQRSREPQFVPLPYAGALPPVGDWYLTRVSVPRANLAAAGIPVALGRLAEPVEAELIVAVDGTPRAIRILHWSDPFSTTP